MQHNQPIPTDFDHAHILNAMRILLISGEYPPQPGGIGDYTVHLARALQACDHAVAVLTASDGQFLLYDLASDRPSPVCDRKDDQPQLWNWSCWSAIIAAIDSWRPDWLHIQYQTGAYGMHPAINLLPWRLQSLHPRPRCAVTFHDLLEPYLFPKAGRVRRWVTRRLAVDADAVVATNHADLQQLRLLRSERSRVAPSLIPIGSNIPVLPPPGYRPEIWRAQLGLAPETFLVACFGLITPSKGVDLLIEALAQIGDDLPWQLLLVGGMSTAPYDAAFAASINTRLQQPDLARRSTLTGHVDPAQVSAALLAADCVVLPYRDGASFRRGSLLAALAHARPVITSTPADADTQARLVSGTHALLVSPESVSALAATIEQLAADPALATALGAAGARLANEFTWPQIAARHEVLYAMSNTKIADSR